jgi:uncharacterized protein involved in exopolysaccharide biosynthesis
VGVEEDRRVVSTRLRPQPEPEGEQEVELGRYAAALAARWWLPLVGLVAGLVAGYLLSVSGGDVYRAETVLYLGQPFSPAGGAPVQSLATHPLTVGEIVRSEAAIRRAARAAGVRPGQLRGTVSTQTLTATPARAGATPLVEVAVELDAPGKAARAANALAAAVVENAGIAGYVETKIETFRNQLATQEESIESIAARLDALERGLDVGGLEPLEQLVLISQIDNAEQRRGQLVNQRAETEQLLALAESVERSRVVEPAIPREVTARSRRNSLIVAGILGLLAGLAAALAWDPLAERLGRRDRA